MSSRDANDDASVPEITVVFSHSTPALNVDIPDDASSYAPSSPVNNVDLLSPRSIAINHPRDGRASPTTDSFDGSCPPSPTISDHSSHFPTSTALRENRPDYKFRLYQDTASMQSHSASITDVSEPGHSLPASDLLHVASTISDVTHVNDPRTQSKLSGLPDTRGDTGKFNSQSQSADDSQNATETMDDEADGDPAPFMFKPHELAHMLDPKSLDTLARFGGVQGLLHGLGTDPLRGLSSQTMETGAEPPDKGAGLGASHRHDTTQDMIMMEKLPQLTLTDPSGTVKPALGISDNLAYLATLHDRRRVYGENVLPHRSSKTLLQLMWSALKDKVLVLLSIAAVVSLALGLFQDFGTPRPAGEPPVDWVEGVAIMIAISIVVIVGSLNDWQKERQFRSLNEKKEERGVKVIRDGIERLIDVKEVVVGDVALLEPGEIVPCDGVFLTGHSVKCDESGATGESDAIKKVSYEECLKLHSSTSQGKKRSEHTDCFILSGSKVLEGIGFYVVVAVGTKSFNGRIMMALRGDTENTPLQLKLNNLAELIAKLGTTAGLFLFTALMIRFFVQLGKHDPPRNANENGIAFVNILIISVTLIVVAVPEGLPLAVTLALAFATKRMTQENLLVRVLGSCETMANASVICTDKTGTLTQNRMTVVAGSVGVHAKFVRQLKNNASRTNATEEHQNSTGTRKFPEDFSIDQTKLNTVLSPLLRELFNEAIAINLTAFQDIDPETNNVTFIGSKTETALLQFAKELGWPDFQKTREAAKIVEMIPFSSERKAMGVVVQLPNGRHRLYIKGASEVLTKKCTRHVVVDRDGWDEGSGLSDSVETKNMDSHAEEDIDRTIIFYANQSLRTIAVCYRDLEQWVSPNAQAGEQSETPFELLAEDLTLVGIVGIEDPLRDGVHEAVLKCHKAGVTVKMCTGDNVLTARSIASQCGIFSAGGIIMEGPAFRKLSQAERLDIVPRLQVLARSSPDDKKILVETLKHLGHVVGVTGDGTNDGPALKTANRRLI
ncbi:hypothetical protein AX17_001997 [Amanita inopinata Kibby_2008]|nr:hypothetical protein AX17_001997 [Amanita inopinata Kibby_2008]